MVQVKNQISEKLLFPISFSSYEIKQDISLGGYKLKLNWNNNLDNILYFTIYKTILPQNLLKKEYTFSNKALEKLTSAKSIIDSESNILYNKNYTIERQNLENQKYNFFKLKSIIPKKGQKTYEYFDKNIFLSKSYSYVITYTNSSMQESPKTNFLNISIEDLRPPQEPNELFFNDSPRGISITIKNKEDKKIIAFKIFKANKELKEEYKEIATIDSKDGIAIFLDQKVIPGNEYFYKIFSIDYFGNLSLNSKIGHKGYNPLFLNDATIPFPEVVIEKVSDGLLFKSIKNHEDIIGITIQRKDIWLYEQDFSFKSYSSFIWPNVVLFDKNGYAEFKDIFLLKDKIYQYRIYNILKSGRIGSYWFSEKIILNNFQNKNTQEDVKINNKFKLKDFKFDIIHNKQNPVYSKFNINFEGDIDNIIVSYDQNKIYIDPLNKEFYISFPKDRSIRFNIDFIKSENVIYSLKNLLINT